MQELILTGNLGRDPEMRFTPKGVAFTNFSVAVSDYNKETAWFRITAWGDQAENCNKYLAKGSKVFVRGRLTFDAETGGPKIFISSKDGQPRSQFEVSASYVEFLDSKSDSPQREEQPSGKVPWKH